jgi:endonuclease YncB( thermonuclease family)
MYRLQVRLNGIDTPEIKGKCEDEKKCAKMVRDALSGLILNKEVVLKNIQSEKYGRILADVYFGDIHVNEWLLSNRYAVRYSGGKKVVPAVWSKYISTGETLAGETQTGET